MNEKQLCPGYNFVFTSYAIEQASFAQDSPCPTVAIYKSGEDRMGWSHMELFAQMKRREFCDPYQHEISSNNDYTDESLEVRGELLQFAAFQMAHQHRLFIFALGIYGHHARFYRFDPSSIAVSASFNYQDDPKTLVEFLLRYSALSSVERGFDPTVIPATDAEKELYRSHIRDYLERVKEQRLRQYPGILRALNDDAQVSKIQVNDMDGKVHWFLGYRPALPRLNSDPCGRLTRGYIVVPVSSIEKSGMGKLYWLKDCWRWIHSEPEPKKHQHLKSMGVPNLPELVCGGDIVVDGELQETENAHFSHDPSIALVPSSATVQRMVHHRLVQGLLIPLWYIESARELIRAGCDASECKYLEFLLEILLIVRLIAIIDAYYNASMLHQDVSMGNVMLTEERSDGVKRSGILIDWERAEGLDSLSTDCRMVCCSLHLLIFSLMKM